MFEFRTWNHDIGLEMRAMGLPTKDMLIVASHE